MSGARFEQLTLWAGEEPNGRRASRRAATRRKAAPLPPAITRRPAWSRRRRNYLPVTDLPDIATYRAA